MKLYAVVDKKSSVAEYFIASCDEDAIRIWFVMLRGSAPMREFLDDFLLLEVRELPSIMLIDEADIVMDGLELKFKIQEREESKENARKD